MKTTTSQISFLKYLLSVKTDHRLHMKISETKIFFQLKELKLLVRPLLTHTILEELLKKCWFWNMLVQYLWELNWNLIIVLNTRPLALLLGWGGGKFTTLYQFTFISSKLLELHCWYFKTINWYSQWGSLSNLVTKLL